MNKLNIVLGTITLAVLLVLCHSSVQAQATRTWVSGVGGDVNPCSRTAPCKTFAGAISKTAAGGEISVLDAGGYGTVTITKSITINADAMLGSIIASGTNGININAGVNDVVTIRGISINGAGTGLSGVRYIAGKHVSIENCTIMGFTKNGIDVELTNSGAITVKNTTISGGTATTGVNLSATSGTVSAILDRVNLQNLGFGLNVSTGGVATISKSTIAQNATTGVRALNNSVINVDDCVITQNAGGVIARSGATVRLSNVSITDNAFGLGGSGGTIASYRNNKIAGNTNSAAPTLYLDINQ